MARRLRIYRSIKYLIGTFLVIALPFIFLLIFSGRTDIARVVLLKEIGVSFSRILISYLIAASLAWLFAILFYKGKAEIIALPIFDVLQSFPTFAALPLAVFLWGPSNTTIIIFLTITIIWPIFFSIISSLKLIKQDWQEVTQITNLKGSNYLRKYLFPISIPGLVTGSIIGLGEGWEALVATEIIVGVRNGLGNFFDRFSNNPTITVFGILGFLLIIFAINKTVWIPLLEKSHKMMEE
jgi:ABC-type nitrate/sulfonate/bicarbonate transport system permease component